ncbi:NAD(P)-dependent oxidoreductase [Arenicella sp.]|nr:NAD(P)-dependent oxidoreductase [Arenicella sp.]
MQENQQEPKVILYGGNGFVGTAIAEELVHQGVAAVCVSRTGAMPVHLKDAEWAQQVAWIRGDALKSDLNLFDGATAVVTLIGSPPVPTFSKDAYAKQLATNSEPNLAVIEATGASPVKRLVVLGAHLPKVIRTDKFAYAKGKRLCYEAAQQFAQVSEQHTAVVLQPTAIYGVRFDEDGKATNVAAAMKPIARLQSLLPSSVSRYLPETLVSVRAVANAAVNACLNLEYLGKFSEISNQQILDQSTESNKT